MPKTTVQQHPKPFWDETTAQISRKLWLPSASLQADEWASEPIGHGWGTCLRWSSTAELRNDWLSVIPELVPQSTEEPGLRVKKLRIYPTAQEKTILRTIKVEKVRKSKKELRARAINKEAVETLKMPWLLQTPHLRRERLDTRTIRMFLISSTVADKSPSRRALSSMPSTGHTSPGSMPFFGT
ncbi:uncharacterized protein V1513DRAFT_459346 [Lipomyces chichibuensis]|uniref:uncharacterized protein n=1 Tax=Lipomyces chichibuensis TaxID=1546026 RepID=UPI003343A295